MEVYSNHMHERSSDHVEKLIGYLLVLEAGGTDQLDAVLNPLM